MGHPLLSDTIQDPRNAKNRIVVSGSPRAGIIASLINDDVSDRQALLAALRAAGIRNFPTDSPTVLRSDIIREAGSFSDNAAGTVTHLNPASSASPIVLNGGSAGDDAVKNQAVIIRRARIELATTGESAAVTAGHRAGVYLLVTYGSKFTGVKTRYVGVNIQGATYSQKEWTEFEDPLVLWLREDTIKVGFPAVDATAAVPYNIEFDADIFPWDVSSARPMIPLVRGCGPRSIKALLKGKDGMYNVNVGSAALADHLGDIRSSVRLAAGMRNI